MLTSLIGIDGKYHLMCNWNDIQINLSLVVGACLDMLLMDVGFLLVLMVWLQVDFVQD